MKTIILCTCGHVPSLVIEQFQTMLRDTMGQEIFSLYRIPTRRKDKYHLLKQFRFNTDGLILLTDRLFTQPNDLHLCTDKDFPPSVVCVSPLDTRPEHVRAHQRLCIGLLANQPYLFCELPKAGQPEEQKAVATLIWQWLKDN